MPDLANVRNGSESDGSNGWEADVTSGSFDPMTRLAAFLVSLLVCASGCSKPEPRYGPGYALSDDDVAAYAIRAGDPSFREREGGQIIGVHNGTRVVSEFPYFDDGMNTAEIIHYDVQPGEPCSRVGGLVRTELVPGPASAVETPFCVPKVLVDRNIPFDR